MKISFECECLLLQKSLLLFCSDFISQRLECDFIVSDKKIESKKPLFLIGGKNAHLKEPFSKKMLLNALEEFYSVTQAQVNPSYHKQGSFENELDMVLSKFKKDLLSLVKKYK